MEAASTFQQSYGLGPRGPNPPYGAQQAQGPHPQAPGPPGPPGPPGAPRPEEQHHKPFFYIQPSQPYMPMQSMQWPVPVPMQMSYSPYYPGLGYGMPAVMPHYQPNPYMEPPGFVVPHTHLHLMDYRRMLNPQYYQTMAYHSRRYRYQHSSQTRAMTSSEVQTEPLSAAQRTSTPGPSEAPSTLPVCSSDSSPSVSVKQQLPPAPAVQKVDPPLELKDTAPSSSTRTPPNGSFVIQTEEVRIECCTTPVGLQLLHAHETAEVSHSFSQDLVQRSVLQGRVRQDEETCRPEEPSEEALQVCPDILLVGTPSEKIAALEESRNQIHSVSDDVGSQAAPQETNSDKDSFNFKVVHPTFDPKYLDELWKMESTVWSAEETLVPSPESLLQTGRTESPDEGLADVEVLTASEEAPAGDVVPMMEMPPLEEDEEEHLVLSVEEEADMLDVPAAEEAPLTDTAEMLLDDSALKADGNQLRRETNVQEQQDTSFESLPAYLPSTSWLADFDNVYYCSKMPPTPQKQSPAVISRSEVPTRRRKLDYKEQPTVRKPKDKYKAKGKVDRRSLSDHECCLNRTLNENTFTPYVSKRERLCSRCVAKNRISSPGLDGCTLKRKAALFQQWNDLPTCEACKSHPNKRLMRKGSSPDVRGLHQDSEGESSENSSCRVGAKWRLADPPRKLNNLKRPLASKQNVEKRPADVKLREKNCLCNELQHQSAAWEKLRHCPHGNAIREMDENCAVPVSLQDKWRMMDQIYLTHRWQTAEKPWKAMTSNNPDSDASKNEARSSYFNKHQKSQPQSHGTCRKDTRC